MNNHYFALADKLEQEHILTREEFVDLLSHRTPELMDYLAQKAVAVRKKIYGDEVFVRGLIEFTNVCKNDCYYCGIRKSATDVERYRLSDEEIMECCRQGYELGFRTFVLQGGEDGYFTDDHICALVRQIKAAYPDCAITLSIGEKSPETYQKYYDAGADRYLLRHETADEAHYSKLHPDNLTAANRQACLRTLKEIGFQIGAGMMVGAPYQTKENIADDLLYLYDLQPHMVGIGPFIPSKVTPFADKEPGTLEETLFLLSIIRLMMPSVLLPATTALGTIHPLGREKGIQAGGNVVMPNLSPTGVRDKYLLYDNKICTGDDSSECRHCLSRRMESVGYHIVEDRGDYRSV